MFRGSLVPVTELEEWGREGREGAARFTLSPAAMIFTHKYRPFLNTA